MRQSALACRRANPVAMRRQRVEFLMELEEVRRWPKRVNMVAFAGWKWREHQGPHQLQVSFVASEREEQPHPPSPLSRQHAEV